MPPRGIPRCGPAKPWAAHRTLSVVQGHVLARHHAHAPVLDHAADVHDAAGVKAVIHRLRLRRVQGCHTLYGERVIAETLAPAIDVVEKRLLIRINKAFRAA